MHQYFAKASRINRGALLRPLLQKERGNDILNLDILRRDVLFAIDDIRKRIYVDSEPQLTLRMNRRLNKLKIDDYAKRDKVEKAIV